MVVVEDSEPDPRLAVLVSDLQTVDNAVFLVTGAERSKASGPSSPASTDCGDACAIEVPRQWSVITSVGPVPQSVKNTDSADSKGYDAGKKVSGIKRHLAVDTQGLPHAIHVTTADVTDRAGALAMFDRRRAGLSQVQNVLVDGGYTGKPFATAVQGLLGASVEVVKRNELHTFVVLPKRWVVERSFAWLEKCRRLWKNCERKLNTSLQMVVLAFMVLILKRS